MTVAIITPENLGRGFALGTATPGKVELDLGAGVDLLFDSVAVVQGVAYDAATGVVTVPAAPGGVWRVTLLVHLNLMTTNTATIALVNAANNLLYPNTQLVLFAAPSTVQAAGSMALDVLYQSATPWTVKARCLFGSGSLRPDYLCGLIVQEL